MYMAIQWAKGGRRLTAHTFARGHWEVVLSGEVLGCRRWWGSMRCWSLPSSPW